MRSIRTKITFLTVCAIVVTLLIATVISTVAIRNLGRSDSDEILYLLCETGERNLDACFESVEQSVETVYGYAQDDLNSAGELDLQAHLDRVRDVFEKTANNTAGILTYYYRIDPAFSDSAKGFWYVYEDGLGFREHEVTDITRYDTDDQSALVWFTVPKATGRSIWLPPYFTDNLDVYVLSYNVPVYKDGRFVGVIGIEIDYTTLIEPVNSITLYENGYAFINDADGYIVYHPRISLDVLTSGSQPKVPDGLLSDSTYVRYRFEGVDKQAVWLELSNGMRLNVTVPIAEINANWHRLIWTIVAVSAAVLLVFVLLLRHFIGHITKPLQALTDAARQVNEGNYDMEMDYAEDDEVGVLTRTFNQLIRHLKIYIGDLSSLAYADALTSVHNKGAFDIYMREMQEKLDADGALPPFAVGMLDCDALKAINDCYGHDKGDLYLKHTSHMICRAFQHTPVFRVGGDEFAIILQNEDYEKRQALAARFEERCAESCERGEPWERISVSMGIAVYDPETDASVEEVTRRADHLMYENKHRRKAGRPD